jgi:hypothetical protein
MDQPMDVGGETVIFALVYTKTNLICKLGSFILKLGDDHWSIKVAPDKDKFHTAIGCH